MNMNEKISFKKVSKDEKQVEKILRPSTTFLQDAWYRFKRNKLGLLGLAIILFMLLFAIFGPMVIPFDYVTQDLTNMYQEPNAVH